MSVLIPATIGSIESTSEVLQYVDVVEQSILDDVEFFVPIYMGPPENLALMSRMPRLAVCQLLTAGYDHAGPFLPQGVTLCNAGGVHDASTAELAVALMLASLRGIDDAARDMALGRWDSRARPGLADRHVVIVGAGGVGRAIRARLEPFEVRITLVGRTSRAGVLATSELSDVLPDADVVVLAVPLDGTTEHLVDRHFLEAMKDGALVVNVARGRVVDTAALVAELAKGRLRAALDVTDPEPLPEAHPLWHQPGALITAHVGGNTSAFLPRARRLVQSQVTAWCAGAELASVVVAAR